MENAEEVMQLLEQFSKAKPKEIPRELEDYLGYVAKTGDPVFQWSLIKILMREKLLAVITDFYESDTLTAELPPCPNVEPFNYDRMKNSLIERFDTFSGAPFTIQRICELLINPRKEYNRADKYMRAIEKNILVVSTREPGTGKRPLECDQAETVLNGIPDVKMHESDGSLLHVPTDLPYLGAPPASNDVTIETTEPNTAVIERVGLGLGINGEVSLLKVDSVKSWPTQESHSLSITHDSEPISSRIGLKSENVGLPLNVATKSAEKSDCDTNSNSELCNVEDTNSNINAEDLQSDSNIGMTAQAEDTPLPDSIDSSESTQKNSDSVDRPSAKLRTDEVVSASDENEVSSTPVNLPEVAVISEVEEPAGSEAEATENCDVENNETQVNLPPDNDKVIVEDETETITISEVIATKSDEIVLECNEISGTVISPISPGRTPSQQTEDQLEHRVNIELAVVEEGEQTNLCPDSSDDLCSRSPEESSNNELGLGSEADSLSGENLDMTETAKQSENENIAPDQSEEIIVQEITEEISPSKFTEEECNTEKTVNENLVISSDAPEEAIVSESSCTTTSFKEDSILTQTDVQSTSEIIEEMYDNERRDESVIQSIPNITPGTQEEITVEEINVDPSCEAEEEAMDVDDCSNQMMVSEGENEGEPMDEGDQPVHS